LFEKVFEKDFSFEPVKKFPFPFSFRTQTKDILRCFFFMLTDWLEQKLMLLTRPKIKCSDGTASMWKYAPVVNASSSHANMRNWTAKVRSMPLPDFPYEESLFMPVACATVQRVKMSKLCEIVKTAGVKQRQHTWMRGNCGRGPKKMS
jgi:hypothetical protein